jgi:hypothetical protein
VAEKASEQQLDAWSRDQVVATGQQTACDRSGPDEPDPTVSTPHHDIHNADPTRIERERRTQGLPRSPTPEQMRAVAAIFSAR